MEDNAMSTFSINIAGRTYSIDINPNLYASDEALYDALYARALAIEEQADAERAIQNPERADAGNVLAAWSTVAYR
jgi:hypothetical protein